MEQKRVHILSKFMPAPAANIIDLWIDKYQCEFKITKSRNSKFGDYRAPFQGKGHRISINHNLNPYAFLVTTVHEFAHLETWNKWNHKVKPHGVEWKYNFQKMMNPFFDLNIFPTDIKNALVSYLKNPAASSCSDLTLFKVLKNYDLNLNEGFTSVEELEINQVFEIKNGRVFKKLDKIRTRFRCQEVKTGLIYLFNPLAEVKLLKEQH